MAAFLAVWIGVGLQHVRQPVVLDEHEREAVGQPGGGDQHQQHGDEQTEAALQEADATRRGGDLGVQASPPVTTLPIGDLDGVAGVADRELELGRLSRLQPGVIGGEELTVVDRAGERADGLTHTGAVGRGDELTAVVVDERRQAGVLGAGTGVDPGEDRGRCGGDGATSSAADRRRWRCRSGRRTRTGWPGRSRPRGRYRPAGWPTTARSTSWRPRCWPVRPCRCRRWRG